MPEAAQDKSVTAILKASSDYLASKRVDESRNVSEILLARLLGCRPMDLHLRSDRIVDEKHLDAMRRGIKRVAQGEPVQYVVGRWEFMGHTFKTDRRALIPRQETEVLVLEVLSCKQLWEAKPPAIVDTGTGSGCIVISLALERPDAHYIALDTSAEALQLAKENAAVNGLQDKIAFAGLEMCEVLDPESMDAIVANLPYIPTAEYERLPVHIRNHEPRAALDGGPTGLSVIEAVSQDAAMALKPGGFLFLEIGCDQASAVTAHLSSIGFTSLQVKKDLCGRDRVVKAVLPC